MYNIKVVDLLFVGSVYIGWINDVSAFISLSSKENANKAHKSLKKGYNYTVMTYAQYKGIQEGGKTETLPAYVKTQKAESPDDELKQENRKRKRTDEGYVHKCMFFLLCISPYYFYKLCFNPRFLYIYC